MHLLLSFSLGNGPHGTAALNVKKNLIILIRLRFRIISLQNNFYFEHFVWQLITFWNICHDSVRKIINGCRGWYWCYNARILSLLPDKIWALKLLEYCCWNTSKLPYLSYMNLRKLLIVIHRKIKVIVKQIRFLFGSFYAITLCCNCFFE